MKGMAKVTVCIVAFFAIMYVAVVSYMVLAEDSFIFHPNGTTRSVTAPPDSLHLKYNDLTIKTPDSETLKGWQVLASDTATQWVLFLHGNAGNISDNTHPQRAKHFVDMGYNFMIFDYRGFGASTGKPSEQGLYTDAQTVYNFLTQTKKVPANKIIIYGWSLGSGVAINLASTNPCKALITEGAYTTIPAVGQSYYPFIPVELVAKNRFDSFSKIAKVQCPVLLLHSPTDLQIPFYMSESLFQRATSSKKQLVRVVGGHVNAQQSDPNFYKAIALFLK